MATMPVPTRMGVHFPDYSRAMVQPGSSWRGSTASFRKDAYGSADGVLLLLQLAVEGVVAGEDGGEAKQARCLPVVPSRLIPSCRKTEGIHSDVEKFARLMRWSRRTSSR